MHKPTASLSLQIIPTAKNKEEALQIIDKVIAQIADSGLSYEVGPMETTIEGDLDVLIELLKKAQHVAIEAGAESVFSNVKIIYNPKGVMTINEKVDKHR